MRKHAIVLTLTVLEILALLLLAFFWWVMRPDLMSTYGIPSSDEAPAALLVAATLPASTRIALTTAVVPIVGAVGALLFAGAWVSGRGINFRNRLLAVALVVTVLGLGWAVWASYAPAFEHL